MECDQVSTWLDAYIDLELEPDQAAQLVAHVRGCPRCAQSVLERQRLRSALGAGLTAHRTPPHLRRAIEAASSPAAPGAALSAAPRRGGTPRWAFASLAACLLLIGALAWNVLSPLRLHTGGAEELVRDAVSSHIRSLMGAHLADIAVSDQHAVKPWFAGKVEFSPRVIDFADQGFPLAGGRLDYIAGRPAAAVIYTRRAHVINVLSCPDAGATNAEPRTTTDRGYHAVAWSEPGVRYCAVSDVNVDELMTLVKLVRTNGNGPK